MSILPSLLQLDNKHISLKKQVAEASLQLRSANISDSAQIMQQISTLQQKVKEMRCINIKSHDLLLLMTFSPSLCFPWCTGVAAGRRKCEAKATLKVFFFGGLQAMEMPNPGKQIMAEKENVVNEDGQSSESVTNALHPGGPQECDDSSVTSLKLGYVSEVNIYAILQSQH
ncbi:hypothetical protein BHM03_00054414 [Ensete ventricosum]|nr:hypothetical protein BHM03_00054414 [Ensete ventricosum]